MNTPSQKQWLAQIALTRRHVGGSVWSCCSERSLVKVANVVREFVVVTTGQLTADTIGYHIPSIRYLQVHTHHVEHLNCPKVYSMSKSYPITRRAAPSQSTSISKRPRLLDPKLAIASLHFL